MLSMLVLVLATSGVLAGSAVPASGGPRALVESGSRAYIQSGASAAMAAWVKGGSMEANPQAMTQANALRQVEDFYGKPIGFDILRQTDISEKASTIYFTINYEKGIAFAKLNAYKKPDGTWVTTSFFFHTEAAQVFPTSLQGLN